MDAARPASTERISATTYYAMRIAVNGWFAGRQTTGSGQYLHHVMSFLPKVRAGVEIDLFAPSHSYDPAWHRMWPDIRLIPIDTPPLPRSLRKLWWEQVAFPRAAQRRAATVIWVPYWAAPLWQPVPVVVTVHDVIPLILSEYRGNYQHRAYTWLVSQTARRADSIITVSQSSAKDIIRRLGITPERVHVVYHGPNISLHSSPVQKELENARMKYQLPSRYFLYLGGFDVRKNVETVIRAYAKYKEIGGDEVALVIAGSLPEEEGGVTSNPRRAVYDLGLEEHVHFCGWVADEDKPALYALATAFIFPSVYEGFGMMTTEAMAAGTPVITSSR